MRGWWDQSDEQDHPLDLGILDMFHDLIRCMDDPFSRDHKHMLLHRISDEFNSRIDPELHQSVDEVTQQIKSEVKAYSEYAHQQPAVTASEIDEITNEIIIRMM